MKRFIIISTVIIASLLPGCSRQEVDEYATITFMIGEVTMNNAEVDIGDIVKEKDRIVTGSEAFCDIKIGGSILRIKEKSTVLIANLMRSGKIENTELDLSLGKMLCKPKKLLKSESFLVKTPTAVAGVRGTKFIVEADMKRTTRVKVFDGKVKIARRIKQFEGSIEKVLEVSPVVSEKEKVVITEKEVKKAERIVEKALKDSTLSGKKEIEIVDLIKKTEKHTVIPQKAIAEFAASDFTKEDKEIIEIKAKPAPVIKKIVKVIMQEKEKPKPEGRLLVTRFEIYFIKNGKVMWEGKVINKPVKLDDKLYIASGDYVFCAQSDGPVLWRKKLPNDGKLELKKKEVHVFSNGKPNRLDLETGDKL